MRHTPETTKRTTTFYHNPPKRYSSFKLTLHWCIACLCELFDTSHSQSLYKPHFFLLFFLLPLLLPLFYSLLFFDHKFVQFLASLMMIMITLLPLLLLPSSSSSSSLFLNNYPHSNSITNSSLIFSSLANQATHPFTTDKVKGHNFQVLYGSYLLPYIDRLHALNSPLKFMEVGMGCNPVTIMKKKGMDIWARMLTSPLDSLWLAEYNEGCVMKMRRRRMIPKKVNVLLGDQSNITTLDRWVEESGGGFDIFIDDGGHSNKQIMTTFRRMWREVKPGGLYFLEDLHVSRIPNYEDTKGELVVADVVRDWIEQLMIPNRRLKHRLPHNVKLISCQAEMCVLVKCSEADRGVIKTCRSI